MTLESKRKVELSKLEANKFLELLESLEIENTNRKQEVISLQKLKTDNPVLNQSYALSKKESFQTFQRAIIFVGVTTIFGLSVTYFIVPTIMNYRAILAKRAADQLNLKIAEQAAVLVAEQHKLSILQKIKISTLNVSKVALSSKAVDGMKRLIDIIINQLGRISISIR